MTEHIWRISAPSPSFRGNLDNPKASAEQPSGPDALQTDLKRELTKPCPLNPAQQRLFFLEQFNPEVPLYHESEAVRLKGKLNVAALEQALNYIVSRHEILRSTINLVDGNPVLLAHDHLPLPFKRIDLKARADAEREVELERLLIEEPRRPFHSDTEPGIRATLVELGPEEHILVVITHQIICDRPSLAVLWAELRAAYEALAQGQTPHLPALPIQYADFAAWQRQQLAEADPSSDLKFWTEKLRGAPAVLDLPLDRPRPAVASYRGNRRRFQLGSELVAKVRDLSRGEKASLYNVLTAGWNALLDRYTGQGEISLGIPVPAATGPICGRLIGFFTESQVLRTSLAGDPTFRELIGRVQRGVVEVHSHKALPFAQVVEALKPERDLSYSPFFQVKLDWRDREAQLQFVGLPGIEVEPLLSQTQTSTVDFSVFLSDAGDDISMEIEYNTDIFDEERIARMAGHYFTLLEAAAAHPEGKISSLPLLTAPEREELVVGFNRTQVDYPQGRYIHELFSDQAAKTPNAIALVFEGRKLTYRELDAKSNQLARYLRKLGVKTDTLVGVCAERSLEMVIALYGIVKAGGAYVPIDPDYPAQRLEFMLKDSAVSLLLTQAHLIPNLPPSPAQMVSLDADWSTIAAESDAPPETRIRGKDLAYMIYTSGSTGQPKGAMNTHEAILNRLQWMQEAYQLTAGDCVLQKTPFSFDVSVWEFFWPLMYGARLVVAQPGGHRDPGYLAQIIAREKVTTLHFVPSMLQIFLGEEGLAASCASVKRVICSGEALPLEAQRRFFATLGAAELHNLYGPTEAAVDVTYWACQRDSTLHTVPIGRPIANTQIYLLDPQLQPVPLGHAGELHIGGIGLARGYHGRPELTAQKFIRDPFSSDPQARLYKTGDLARFLPDGTIEYLGRLDHQVKLRGFRIELGEIEELLNQHPGVAASTVMAREDTPGDQRLVAYLVAGKEPVPAAILRDHLRSKLPDYMVPSAFVTLPELPLSPNGKVDRKALPKPDAEVTVDRPHFVAPGTEVEIALAKIWSDVLNLLQVGLNDNFFEIGGNSMLAMLLIRRMARELGFSIPIPVFFQNSTVGKLAAIYDREKSARVSVEPSAAAIFRASAAPDLIPFQESGSRPPLFFLHGDWAGGGIYCGRLSRGLSEEQPFYALPPYRVGKEKVLNWDEMVEHHLAVLRAHTPRGPYLLGGYCAGAKVAMDMAKKLVEQGEEVPHLFLVDLSQPFVHWMHHLWPIVDRMGDRLKWTLMQKIRFFDRYPIAAVRWYQRPAGNKMEPILRRLGLVQTNHEPIRMGFEVNEFNAEVLESLDYAVYFLGDALHRFEPIDISASLYFSEGSFSESFRRKRAKETFREFTLDMVPGDHQTCITTNINVTAQLMEQALAKLYPGKRKTRRDRPVGALLQAA
jgi:amino acid adenylation domain-containing protein